MTGTAEVISKDELTTARLMEIYQSAYFNASADPDGDVRLNVHGITMFTSVDPNRALLRLWLGLPVKPKATRQQLIEFCNRINDGLVLIRACVPASFEPQLMLLLDHYLDTNAGVTALEVIDETRRVRLVLNSLPPLDTDGVLS